ncbi:hypothetical protein E4U09_001837 [Claviceps aff. purpurea]|uniref:Uncharacterized protein n=1 Tax=Claviceps aff. purpurea TaxID=1967640 RepID=A0A9P7QIM7_9HYPO|nr:hypothetical protein E4U09_001837 [Claviceps aff. purpurea]
MRAFSLLTLLLPFVAANTHHQCDCLTWSAGGDWIQNADLTHYVCLQWSIHTYFDDKSNRCKTVEGSVFDGKLWEENCIDFGTKRGYYPVRTDGTIDTSKKMTVGAATGSCPNRG